jgi:hypothetical protein
MGSFEIADQTSEPLVLMVRGSETVLVLCAVRSIVVKGLRKELLTHNVLPHFIMNVSIRNHYVSD